MRDVRALPKAHLHVHLESAIRPGTLAELAASHGLPAPVTPPGRYAGFRAFADAGELVRGCLRTAADFERVAREFVADEAADGVGWTEVTFTAASHGERLGDPEMPLEAVLRGLAAGAAEHGIGAAVILDHSRRRPAERFRRTVELAERHEAVVAVGVAGDESYPLTPFLPVIAAATVPMVHHAGEAAGPAGVREAIGPGRAVRIGHGIRALDDPDLVAELRDRRVPLEVCPTSNVALGFAGTFEDHPLPRLLDAGLLVTLNTDVPALVGTTLSREYRRAREAFGWADDTLAALARASVESSFAPAPVRDRLLTAITAWLTAPPRSP